MPEALLLASGDALTVARDADISGVAQGHLPSLACHFIHACILYIYIYIICAYILYIYCVWVCDAPIHMCLYAHVFTFCAYFYTFTCVIYAQMRTFFFFLSFVFAFYLCLCVCV
eukprot:TRINITY_DN12961_c0_g1_i1.p2 TRINITY_DN12961_c0_g1~~TRINITY_DN12961_c0_g1_i1.p2  ORF type:complete len:114 (-),score=0.73 TRINITY_DN12961_c0_g1_i1:159-500(-)